MCLMICTHRSRKFSTRNVAPQPDHFRSVVLCSGVSTPSSHMTAQQALPFLFTFSLTSSDALAGTRTEMCTVVRLSAPVSKLHSATTKHSEKKRGRQALGIRGRRMVAAKMRTKTAVQHGNMLRNAPSRVLTSSRNFPKCRIRISSVFEGPETTLGVDSLKKSTSSDNAKRKGKNSKQNAFAKEACHGKRLDKRP